MGFWDISGLGWVSGISGAPKNLREKGDFGDFGHGLYINPLSIGSPFLPAYKVLSFPFHMHLGGVATACHPSGGRLMWM
jgi:hypothetical protein